MPITVRERKGARAPRRSTTQAEILKLLARLQAEHGMAVLFITHDMGVVAQIADDVAVMYRGRVVEQGARERLLSDPQHEYTRGLLAASKKLSIRAPSAAPTVQTGRKLLEINGLSLTYPGRLHQFRRADPPNPALTDITLDLHEGENLGIVGESGSGKTTLGNCIMRILQPSAGRIAYTSPDGRTQDLLQLDRRALLPIHGEMRMVFQDPFSSLNPRMNVEQVIAEPLRVRGLLAGAALRTRVAELLEMVGLPADAMRRYPHAFSGGQRQRIAIARALAPDPRLVIADEPTSALDVTIRGQILDLLLDLQRRLGLSYVFISHDLGAVRYFCNRVVVMRRSQIVEVGTAEQICLSPQQDYTRALIAAVPEP